MRYIKTRAIVLHQIRYGETSLICRVFTRESGLVSLMIKGARSSKSSLKASRFQLMNVLDIVITDKPGGGIQYVREASLSPAYQFLPYDDWRRSTGIFLTEVLYRILQESAVQAELFDFAEQQLLELDSAQRPDNHFLLYQLLHLSRLLGLYPLTEGMNEGYFLWGEGAFYPSENPSGASYAESRLLEKLLLADQQGDSVSFTPDERYQLLNLLLKYLSWHIESLQQIRSLDILREIYHSGK